MQFPDSLHKIAKPVHKYVWAWPVAINFFLGGTAAGYYLLWVLCVNFGAARPPGAASGGFLAAALVLTGFAALSLEAGRPLRARFLTANWKRSWMSRETAAGIVFVIAAGMDALVGSATARALAVGAACAFMLSQGMMIFRCTAVPVWRDAVLPVLIVSSGLAGGYALLLLNRYGLILPQISVSPVADTIAIAGLSINLAAWMALLRRRRDAAMQAVMRRMRQPVRMVTIIGVGQALPVILLLLARPWSSDAAGSTPVSMAVVAALAILYGNWAQKLCLLRYAQNVCGMQLKGEQ